MINFNAVQGRTENESIEAKRSEGGLPESLWETYSAFANTKGGIILLGVEEDFDKTLHACGVDNAQMLVDAFWRAVRDPEKASACVLSQCDVYIQNESGRDIVVIQVPTASTQAMPVYIGGSIFSGAYKRDGEADMCMSKWEVYDMLRRKWVNKIY
jgi:predicted HTH transcriptional regulator